MSTADTNCKECAIFTMRVPLSLSLSLTKSKQRRTSARRIMTSNKRPLTHSQPLLGSEPSKHTLANSCELTKARSRSCFGAALPFHTQASHKHQSRRLFSKLLNQRSEAHTLSSSEPVERPTVCSSRIAQLASPSG